MRISKVLTYLSLAALLTCTAQNIVADIQGLIENGNPVVTGNPVKHYTEDDPQWCYVDGHKCMVDPESELDTSQVHIIEGVGELVCPTPDKNDKACTVENHTEGEK